MRNPIGALVNWLRVVRDGGLLYLIVPDKRRTFDQLRVRTTLEHMVLDYQQPSRSATSSTSSTTRCSCTTR